ncbi:SRPBCC domain-containing protein [Streptomyces ficellus]|uniref:SRPBCC domain-containing protein n=1 Tax=Streptomyces ficellus TaxID=1977088 RepID=A0ABT7Z7W0_9ACTN|nr:SRPBCC domain-containing protein [Streptomyces ficellus]MDN3295590.1 SRPBCC domain-containing protein [Streptomyces ficellus]
MADPIPPGRTETHGDTHIVRFAVPLPHPPERVWLAISTPGGLRGWLAETEVLEPHLGGTVILRRLTTGTVGTGTITAWDVERIVEYTLEPDGRIRLHLEPGNGGPETTVLRFLHEFRGTDEVRLDRLADWHDHFTYLFEALDGKPADWPAWSRERWQELRDKYEARDYGAT